MVGLTLALEEGIAAGSREGNKISDQGAGVLVASSSIA